MNYYVYLLTIVVDRSVFEQHVGAHRQYLKQLDEQGILVISGPFADRRGGMVMIRAESEEAARAIADADPLVTSGSDTYELRHWRITEGDPQRIQLEGA